MTTKVISLDDQIKEILDRYQAQIRSISENATAQGITGISNLLRFQEGETQRLKAAKQEEIRALLVRNNSIAPTLDELSRIRGKRFIEPEKTRYFMPLPTTARTRDKSEHAYWCKDCDCWILCNPKLETISGHLFSYCVICMSVLTS